MITQFYKAIIDMDLIEIERVLDKNTTMYGITRASLIKKICETFKRLKFYFDTEYLSEKVIGEVVDNTFFLKFLIYTKDPNPLPITVLNVSFEVDDFKNPKRFLYINFMSPFSITEMSIDEEIKIFGNKYNHEKLVDYFDFKMDYIELKIPQDVIKINFKYLKN